jgi:hypothetical protein
MIGVMEIQFGHPFPMSQQAASIHHLNQVRATTHRNMLAIVNRFAATGILE